MKNSIEKYMSTDVVSFNPDDDIVFAMRVLLDKRLSGAPVLDAQGRVVGILSKKDCLSIVYNTAYQQDWGGKVEHYMSHDVVHIEVDSSIVDAIEKFIQSRFRRFPVLDKGQLVGIISRHDILRALDEVYLKR